MSTGTIIAIAVGAVVVLRSLPSSLAPRVAGVTNVVASRRASFARRPEAVRSKPKVRARRLMSRPPKPSVRRLRLRNAPLRRGRDVPPQSDRRLRLSI